MELKKKKISGNYFFLLADFFSKKKKSIAALSFNGEGKKLAIASSYTFEEGEKE